MSWKRNDYFRLLSHPADSHENISKKMTSQTILVRWNLGQSKVITTCELTVSA